MRFHKSIVFMMLVAASSVTVAQILTKTATTITNSSSLNPSAYGQAVTFKAVVSPKPPNGETVTFEQGSLVLGTGSLTGGTATFTISTLGVGTENIYAIYSGDPAFKSSSTKLPQVVNPAGTTTSLVSSQSPVNAGQPVTFTATVTPAIRRSGPLAMWRFTAGARSWVK